VTTRQYARLVSEWIASIGLDPLKFGTHSLRRTKATVNYRRTGNLRAVQLRSASMCSGPAGHSIRVRFLGQTCRMMVSHERRRAVAESARGISPRAAHRTVRKPLDLYGSCHRMKAAAFR
jgi:hypothetical protein